MAVRVFENVCKNVLAGYREKNAYLIPRNPLLSGGFCIVFTWEGNFFRDLIFYTPDFEKNGVF